MSKINGTLIYLRQGVTPGLTQTTLVGQTDATMNMTGDTMDSTCKDNVAKAKTYLAGETGWTLSVSGLYDPAATVEGSISNAITDLKAGTSWTVSFGEVTTDNNYWYGTAIITGVTINGPKNDVASYSLEMQGSAVLTETSN